jgi:hypothetical protein
LFETAELLAGRPGVMTAAEEMDVQMVDCLAAVFAGVDDYAIAFAEALVASDRRCGVQEMAEQVAVLSGGVVEGSKVFAGNDEDMDGRDRVNVREGVAELVLIDGCGGDGTVGNFAEYAGHGVTSRARPVYNRAESAWDASDGCKRRAIRL